jgi:hypothetical protein
MSTIDDLLGSQDHGSGHPVVQWLKARLADGEEIRVVLQWSSSPLAPAICGLIVQQKVNGEAQAPQIYEWDDDLNAAMIDMGIRAVDIQQEGERSARVLRAALRKVERRYGDGYMNAVLVDLLDASDLGKKGEIAKVRKMIHADPPDRDGRSYTLCRDTIASEIGGRAKELREKLRYDPEELKTVMDIAIARYLDERFSISTMRRLGWIDEAGHTTR